jgi:outer membrane protein assembly factor BamB
MPRVLLALFLATAAHAQDWPQWGRTPQHDGATTAAANRLDRIEAKIVIDPLIEDEKANDDGEVLVHYPVPLIDGDDLFLLEKGGVFTTHGTPRTQVWKVKNVRRTSAGMVTRWMFESDWYPVPTADSDGGPQWEPVFHPVLGADAVWVPGAGGTMLRVRRADGALLGRVNPFGTTIDNSVFTAGPPVLDAAGNLFYNAIQLQGFRPWASAPRGSWLVRIAPDGTTSLVSFDALTPNAPAADAMCTGVFPFDGDPLPPSASAVAPTAPCGAQRPGINSTPAVGADGTIYTVSRAHFNFRYGFIIAVNPDMTPKWATSMRERFLDGCGVLLPPNGRPGGCRSGSIIGVDPLDNRPGSGAVVDDSTSSPVVLPDGTVIYGAYSAYNYSQGHLMKFSAAGAFLAAYRFGWDITPAVYRHDATYSIVLKENHYNASSYCFDPDICPPRNDSAPNDPEQYFITQLDPSLRVEWQFRNTQTDFCFRDGSAIRCEPVTTHGFEWCVNAVAVDRNGTVLANSEDGFLYAIAQGGALRQRIFLDTAQGAAYTPLSLGADGRIYTQNNGTLFVVGEGGRRRAVGK